MVNKVVIIMHIVAYLFIIIVNALSYLFYYDDSSRPLGLEISVICNLAVYSVCPVIFNLIVN
jgi:hypothetical protein